jgi:KinB signaling pathway activation protein
MRWRRRKLTLRKWFYLFWTTLAIGIAASLLTGIYLMVVDPNFEAQSVGNVVVYFLNMIIIGATYSVFAQMGFFAYLTVNYIALYIIRRMEMWKIVQALLIIIVLVDLVVLRYILLDHDQSWVVFTITPIILLVAAWLVAWQKVKLTNKGAWIPTLFFMIVATTIEAVPGLKLLNAESTFFMMFPLFVCNAWQILKLHTLVKTEQKS